ncbi:MAG TPA: hypothetical protein PLB78_04430, partial [Anaerolineae bacterium]|nr:hypothetical protein [Anaerolineae bacterium]
MWTQTHDPNASKSRAAGRMWSAGTLHALLQRQLLGLSLRVPHAAARHVQAQKLRLSLRVPQAAVQPVQAQKLLLSLRG